LVESIQTPPADWLKRFNEDGSSTAAQAFGEEWFQQKRSAILSAPSALIGIERNFVLNPYHADFAKVAIGAASKLDLDPCLWSTAGR
jgi:RES domain-containing protein